MEEAVKGTETFERFLVERDDQEYVLRLYVTGMTPRSTEAVAVLKDICETLLNGRYDLEVVDLYSNPERAATEQVVAAPTLVRRSPPPLRRLIGNLSDRERVVTGLGLQTTA
jgi:circadian clock protein KaiB